MPTTHGVQCRWARRRLGVQPRRPPAGPHIATLDALELVASRLDGATELYLDGGVRSGLDVLTSVAIGATAVFIGRPAAYGLAIAGSEGVQAVLTQLRRQLKGPMALSGCPTLADVDRRLVR
jgi:4-hydroxymandelate oxidase